MDEDQLEGGNSSAVVTRVGDTVRKQWTSSTESVNAFVRALIDSGVDAPKPMGRDDDGRSVQEFIPGQLAMEAGPLSPVDLARVGSMVREIHDASEHFTPPSDAVWNTAITAPGADLVCHNDLAPWNLIVGKRWVFIDWDASAPSTRLWDLAYSAQAFALNDPSQSTETAAANLAAFVDGYGADADTRSALPAEMARRTAAMYELLRSSNEVGREPWASMYDAGHGAHWKSIADYVESHRALWAKAIDGS